MPEGTAVKKVAGGKMVRVDVSYSERIEKVKITGDFFLHPETAIDRIEASLLGAGLPLEEAELTRRVERALTATGAELYGLSPADIAQTMMEAVG